MVLKFEGVDNLFKDSKDFDRGFSKKTNVDRTNKTILMFNRNAEITLEFGSGEWLKVGETEAQGLHGVIFPRAGKITGFTFIYNVTSYTPTESLFLSFWINAANIKQVTIDQAVANHKTHVVEFTAGNEITFDALDQFAFNLADNGEGGQIKVTQQICLLEIEYE